MLDSVCDNCELHMQQLNSNHHENTYYHAEATDLIQYGFYQHDAVEK
jgi:hypothetical protein